MCGIVGAVAKHDIVPILLDGLQRLEYRGYDSAGIAVIDRRQIERIRVTGKVQKLITALAKKNLCATIGIAHTRWATHGKPCEKNAHPHMSQDNIAIVHNGIIENHVVLRKQLLQDGVQFNSDTDSEIIGHLLNKYLPGRDLLQAVFLATQQLEGAFALGIMHNKEPERLIAVRSGSPLVIGLGEGENFLASDSLALMPVTQKFIYLEEGDIADITLDDVIVYGGDKQQLKRQVLHLTSSGDATDRGKFRHYMQKEIFEQVAAIENTLDARVGKHKILDNIFGEASAKIFKSTQRVQIVACGTSYHAGLIARFWLEQIAGLPCQVEIASEMRYRKLVVEPHTLFVTISQSGETADTLEALRKAKQLGYRHSLTICNVPQSSLVRESDLAFMTKAGPEIGVASTKAFTTQLTALLMLTIVLAQQNENAANADKLVDQLHELPRLIAQTLALDEKIKELAEFFADKNHAFFLGRGIHYPVAMEGALKLKEVSYIHAESYPAGELKHGPLALIDKHMPVVVVAPNNSLLTKLISNIHEVRARGGKLIVFADHTVNIPEEDDVMVIKMPAVPHAISPIVYTVPLQLLAYYVAVIKGTDVDQPRNLAKSVTVE